MKPRHWILLLLFIQGSVQAQQYTISGLITDSLSGDVLPGTTVWISESQSGTICDQYGFFVLHTNRQKCTLRFHHLGFEPKQWPLKLNDQKQTNLKVELVPQQVLINQAEIRGKPANLEIKNTKPGQVRLSSKALFKVPAILSEPDPLTMIHYLPGVQSVAEGDGYLYVRGGSADQNLILLDGGEIYNPAHLFGVFSVVNPSVIRSVNLYKSAIPANYGNRLASVVDIQTRAPAMHSTHAELNTGIMVSRLTLETPLVQEKLSLLVAGRRSQLDWIFRPLIRNTSFRGSGYYFNDLNLRINWNINPRSRLWATYYQGVDRGKLSDADFGISAGIGWGNRLVGVNHWYRINHQNILISSLHYSNYFLDLDFFQNPYQVGVQTGMNSLKLKNEWQHFHSEKSHWVAGMTFEEMIFNPYQAELETPGSASDFGYSEPVYTFQSTLYAHYNLNPNSRWHLEAGIRIPLYLHHGPYTRFEPGIPGQKAIDSTRYTVHELVSSHLTLEPRLMASFDLSQSTTLKASLSRHSQSIHMVPISTATLPADIWTPATIRTPPQLGINTSLGIFHAFAEGQWEVHAEAYYRDMKNLVEFKEGISTLDLLKYNLDMHMTIGQGQAWGVEFMLRKKQGRFSGWLGYTWSVTKRQFDEINRGKPFYPKHDRRHDLNLVVNWQASEYLDLTLNFIFATGQAVSLPGSYYYFDGKVVNHYGERNNFRMPAYHRIDFSTRVLPKKKRKIQSTWTFSIYNLYNQMNPFFIYFDTNWINENGEFGTRARSLSLLPLIPSFSWTGRF